MKNLAEQVILKIKEILLIVNIHPSMNFEPRTLGHQIHFPKVKTPILLHESFFNLHLVELVLLASRLTGSCPAGISSHLTYSNHDDTASFAAGCKQR